MKTLKSTFVGTLLIFCVFVGHTQQPSVVLSDNDVRDIFNMVFDSKKANSLSNITAEDRKKAIFFLRELMDKSCNVGYIKDLFMASYKIRPNLKKITKTLVKHTIIDCDRDDYYEAVRVTLARNFKSAYDDRITFGDW